MQVQRHDGSQERQVLIGMIVDNEVLATIAPHWDRGLFSSKWSNLIGKWCVEYYSKYNKAPGPVIEELYQQWSVSADRENNQLIEQFLGSLSGEYSKTKERLNTQFILDCAAKYFNYVKIKDLRDQIDGLLEIDKVEDAETLIRDFRRLEVGKGSGHFPLLEKSVIDAVFAARNEILVKYPDALANFFENALERDAFVAFLGMEKIGKTWWLIDLAWRAMTQKRKVAFFEVGDMSQNQIMRRFLVRAARRPLNKRLLRFPTRLDPGIPPEVVHATHTYTDDLSPEKSWSVMQAITKELGGGEFLRLSVHPNDSISVAGVESIISSWMRQGWVPDVVVIDYADILAPMNGTADTRDQINATWKRLRALSQSLHCLVATATQADAASYTSKILGKSNFSEDKRKLAHCTAMIGINQTQPEKDQGLTRLNYIVLRELEFSEEKCCYCAGCLGIGNPAIFSTF